MKFEILFLDHNTRFSLWKIKTQAVLVQLDLDDALLRLYRMLATLTIEEKQRKDQKALSQMHFHLSKQILWDVVKTKLSLHYG